ncbi:MAG: hypothetical protein QM655_16510, partial [Nocardioidaceae bacterium]
RMPEALGPRDVVGRNPGFIGSNFVIRRRAFEDVGGFDPDLRVVNDRDFVYRYLAAGHCYAVVEAPPVLQRKHGAGQLTRATEMRAVGLEKYIDKHRAALSRRDLRSMRLSINRIRFHAADRRADKLRFLVRGLLDASPSSVLESVRNRRQLALWREGRR